MVDTQRLGDLRLGTGTQTGHVEDEARPCFVREGRASAGR
jgi:hypothetical protein